ncbi:hypothetical protein NHP200010_16170 [Helicobacter bizzozeronii]|uniref:hypothetical protein n=1 Tax=Helicobacter bizzozeronii TaxID=56877 RepID=UPI00244D7FB0|nr:hypothetical protein [Helicobacter bizzozeronii]GMB93882.1 hypothetical protein NHP200010_16170 [Helicobacter bizzozeronii]
MKNEDFFGNISNFLEQLFIVFGTCILTAVILQNTIYHPDLNDTITDLIEIALHDKASMEQFLKVFGACLLVATTLYHGGLWILGLCVM